MIINPISIPSTDGVILGVYKYEAEVISLAHNSRPHVLFSHATGFHGRCFDPVAESLCRDFDCTSFDYRGYGDSYVSKDWPVTWQGYGEDALAIARTLSSRNHIIGVGHSMGGTGLIMAALARPNLFRALIIYEPIVFPSEVRDLRRTSSTPNALVEGARRRRTTFSSRAEAYANYSSKPPMNSFDGRSLRAYVDYGFNDVDGCVVLKCRPEHEARTYEMGAVHETWERLHSLSVPAWVVAGEFQPSQPSSWAPLIAKEIPNTKFIQWPDVGHFGPMQQPDRLAQLVREVDDLTRAITSA